MSALISKGLRRRTEREPVLYGVGLRDAREEMFCRMACDGLSLGVAYKRAGFSSTDHDAPYELFALPRLQARAAAILEARRTTGVVTLEEVTDMLKRVFAGAHSAEEYSAAHNAAFSLARLYGHVTDRQTVEVIRRPSRDPDAPSEQALSAWVQDLPGASGNASISPFPGPPASLLGSIPGRIVSGSATGPEPVATAAEPVATAAGNVATIAGDVADFGDLPNEINWLGWNDGRDGRDTPGRPENGAPTGPVTGTPTARARSELLDQHAAVSHETGTRPPGGEEKGAPAPAGQVPVPKWEYPPMEDLF